MEYPERSLLLMLKGKHISYLFT